MPLVFPKDLSICYMSFTVAMYVDGGLSVHLVRVFDVW